MTNDRSPPEKLPIFPILTIVTGLNAVYLNTYRSVALTARTGSFAPGRVGRRCWAGGGGGGSRSCGQRIARFGAEDLPAPWKGFVIKLAGWSTREATDGASDA